MPSGRTKKETELLASNNLVKKKLLKAKGSTDNDPPDKNYGDNYSRSNKANGTISKEKKEDLLSSKDKPPDRATDRESSVKKMLANNSIGNDSTYMSKLEDNDSGSSTPNEIPDRATYRDSPL